MYPGRSAAPGLKHTLEPGLHLVAGVNGLGKSTLLLLLYHGLVGPAAIRNDEFGVFGSTVVRRRDADRFSRRVADRAKEAWVRLRFEIGNDQYEACRSLHDLSLSDWTLNGSKQALDEEIYTSSIAKSMNVSGLADVLIILNLIVFMFEDRDPLMWNSDYQRNILRALFMAPKDATEIAKRGNAVASANSAFRNLLCPSSEFLRQTVA